MPLDGRIYDGSDWQPEPQQGLPETPAVEKPITPLEVLWTMYYWSFAVLREPDAERPRAVVVLATLAVIVAYAAPLLASSGMWKTAIAALIVWPVLTTIGLFTEIFARGL